MIKEEIIWWRCVHFQWPCSYIRQVSTVVRHYFVQKKHVIYFEVLQQKIISGLGKVEKVRLVIIFISGSCIIVRKQIPESKFKDAIDIILLQTIVVIHIMLCYNRNKHRSIEVQKQDNKNKKSLHVLQR